MIKNKLILLLLLIIIPLSCDEEELIENTFDIQIDNATNSYPVLISLSIDNPALIASVDLEINTKLITTINREENSQLMANYELSYAPSEGFAGDLAIKVTAYSKDNITVTKSAELTLAYNVSSFAAINSDIAMINAGGDFLFTKYLITNEQFISYLNSISDQLTRDINTFYNSLNQKVIDLNKSRITFSETFQIEIDEYLNHPVTGVTWYGASNYANYFGWRLPTVDEWKYIASGDSTNWKYPYLNQQANYSWVDTSHTNCNYNGEQDNTTNDITKFESQRSYFGAVDIIGNVYEFTSSESELQSDLNTIVGGSYNSECKFIDEDGDGIEDTNFEPPQLCLQDSCFSAMFKDIPSKTIGFRCIADTDYSHNEIEIFNDCNGTSSADVGFGIFIDECGTCQNQVSSIDNYFCLSDCRNFWDSENQPESINDDCGECAGNLFFTCNNGDSCDPSDDNNLCPNECAVSYQCNYENTPYPCNPKTSTTLGGFIQYNCSDECVQVLESQENNICDCSGDLTKSYYIDNDGDGNGLIGSSPVLLCSATAPSGYSDNNSDINDNCFSNTYDCANVCDGSSIEDNCGDCVLPDNTCDEDCAGVPGGSAIIDECGVCDGPGSIYECGCSDIPEEDCDCNGNVIDCAGDCGGDSALDCNNKCCNDDNYNECLNILSDNDGDGEDDQESYCNENFTGDTLQACLDIIFSATLEIFCDSNYGCASPDCLSDCAGGDTGIPSYDSCGCYEENAANFACNLPGSDEILGTSDDEVCSMGANTTFLEGLTCEPECIYSSDINHQTANPTTSLSSNGYSAYNDSASCCFGCNDANSANYDANSTCDQSLNLLCQYTDYIKIGTITSTTMEIIINTDQDVTGFQFSVSGVTLTGGSGGLAADAGFSVGTGPNGALGFVFGSAVIPSTEGQESILTTLTYTNSGNNNVDDYSICIPLETDANDLNFSYENFQGNSAQISNFIPHHTNACP